MQELLTVVAVRPNEAVTVDMLAADSVFVASWVKSIN